MHSMTIVVLACLVAVTFAHAHQYPAVDEVAAPDTAVHQAYDAPEQEGSVRAKRSLLLLKKKLLLGALGLKAAKVGALGAGALALKKAKSVPHAKTIHVVPSPVHSHGYRSL